MYKALHWTGKQLDAPNMGYVPNIEAAYNELSDDDKKKFDALYEELFRARFMNPERLKAEQCGQNGAKGTATIRRHTAEFHWSENIIKITFIVLAFYSAHTIAKGDGIYFLFTLYFLLYTFGKVFE
ncbi:hypothetical protein K450DRAFT_254133 [Umbelopsis ramanniana AG]|uniref:Uncharacterized protein n=1 Tax=Umbelopsis ramanniana AG TaxID=1314678 RepID=A0AAD5HCD0_UMBRA|nr:uncharacterized protein K450DRAFT_254133 [Umbelopsis ramanniana AG]KAI8577053.1 hypothetical protein K450DRAFT_254133 [Umbelopsis ramanniana AG]